VLWDAHKSTEASGAYLHRRSGSSYLFPRSIFCFYRKEVIQPIQTSQKPRRRKDVVGSKWVGGDIINKKTGNFPEGGGRRGLKLVGTQ
jgi:hypothetical protein